MNQEKRTSGKQIEKSSDIDDDSDVMEVLCMLKDISRKHSELRRSPNLSMKSQIDSNDFLEKTPENPELNQYWYSPDTISTYVSAILEVIENLPAEANVAFLSTPSLYYKMPSKVRERCNLFDVSYLINNIGFKSDVS